MATMSEFAPEDLANEGASGGSGSGWPPRGARSARHRRRAERHGARVERLFGDMLMAFFGFPLAHEDDALRAVRAALEARTAVHALDDDPSRVEGVRNRARAGIETGDIVVAGPGGAVRDVVTGTVLAAAGRL